jgi:hypothetical protein
VRRSFAESAARLKRRRTASARRCPYNSGLPHRGRRGRRIPPPRGAHRCSPHTRRSCKRFHRRTRRPSCGLAHRSR